MPVKTVTIAVTALTDKANKDIAATSAFFQKLKDSSPAELKVKLDTAEAEAQAAILKRSLSGVVSGRVRIDDGGRGFFSGLPGIGRLFRGGSGPGQGLPGPLGNIPGIGTLPPVVGGPAGIGALIAALAAIPFLAQ